MTARKQILTGLTALLLAIAAGILLLPWGIPPAEGVSDVLEFDVSAECSAHADINGPEAIVVLFTPVTSRDAPQLTATLTVPQIGPQTALDHRWGYPESRWHSVLFAGPTVQARFFCQSAVENKTMRVSYYPEANVKIAFGVQPALSVNELDTVNQPTHKSQMDVKSQNGKTSEFSAGVDSINPYYLTFSVPVHAPHDIKTTAQYEFP
jgi:hypothetical protein